MKRRVVGFFVLLLMFAAVLSIVEISTYGKLTIFAILDDIGSGRNITSVIRENQSALFFGVYLFLFLLVAAFLFNFMRKYTERINLNHEGHEERPFKRKIINLDMGG